MEREVAMTYMQDIMVSNKAMGLVAQADFQRWVHESGGNVERKYFNGCWLFSPKGSTATKRMTFFVHNTIETLESIEDSKNALLANRGFHGLCGSLVRAGLGVFYCFPVGNPNTRNLDGLDWTLFKYQNDDLTRVDARLFFSAWPGNGHATHGRPWEPRVRRRYTDIEMSVLESMVLNQVFFTSFVKRQMRKPVADPYDVDGFFVSYEGRILPLEIKEKFPFESNHIRLLGIDFGRILMLLRRVFL